MSYYYNPITGDIKKISTAQKKAYDEHFREERWTQLLDNETTLPTIIAAVTAIAGTAFAGWLLNALFGYFEEEGATVTEEAKDAWRGAVYGGNLVVNVISAPLTGRGDETVPVPAGATAPMSVTYNQLWEYAAKKYLGFDIKN